MQSTILLIAALLWVSSTAAGAGQCEGTLPNWEALKKLPVHSKARPLNVLSVGEGGKLVWNGRAVSDKNVQAFLQFIGSNMPKNVTALVASRNADCKVLVRVRRMMNEQLKCAPATCVQVIG
nr:hypothetical protein [uncultured Sphingosinicella sp.]